MSACGCRKLCASNWKRFCALLGQNFVKKMAEKSRRKAQVKNKISLVESRALVVPPANAASSNKSVKRDDPGHWMEAGHRGGPPHSGRIPGAGRAKPGMMYPQKHKICLPKIDEIQLVPPSFLLDRNFNRTSIKICVIFLYKTVEILPPSAGNKILTFSGGSAGSPWVWTPLADDCTRRPGGY